MSSTALPLPSEKNWRSRLAAWADGESLLQYEDKVLLLLTLIIGALVGLVVAAFIYVTEDLGARMYPAGGAAWRRVLIPTGGALITGYLLSRIFLTRAAAASRKPKPRCSCGTALSHCARCSGNLLLSASLASGIALGREGPSVQVGAGIASVLGRRLGLSSEQNSRADSGGRVGGAGGGFQYSDGRGPFHAGRSDGRYARAGAGLHRARLGDFVDRAAPAAGR